MFPKTSEKWSESHGLVLHTDFQRFAAWDVGLGTCGLSVLVLLSWNLCVLKLCASAHP